MLLSWSISEIAPCSAHPFHEDPGPHGKRLLLEIESVTRNQQLAPVSSSRGATPRAAARGLNNLRRRGRRIRVLGRGVSGLLRRELLRSIELGALHYLRSPRLLPGGPSEWPSGAQTPIRRGEGRGRGRGGRAGEKRRTGIRREDRRRQSIREREMGDEVV